MTERTISAEAQSQLWQEAYGHSGHLSMGTCPDTGMLDSRDPHCFYCSVMTAQDELARLSAWVSGDVARARELADELAEVRYAPPTWVAARAAAIVSLLTPPRASCQTSLRIQVETFNREDGNERSGLQLG